MNSNDFWNRGTPDYSPLPLDQTEDAHGDGDEMLTVVPVGDDQIEEDDSFSLDKFQVVRREFFSHISEPSITFNNYKIGLNSACIKRLPLLAYFLRGLVLLFRVDRAVIQFMQNIIHLALQIHHLLYF